MRVSSDNSNEPKKSKKDPAKTSKKKARKKITVIKGDIQEQIAEIQKAPTPPWKGMSKGRQAKNDYDSDDFYDEVFFLAFNGASDAEIANAFDITPTYFSLIKSGKVVKWSDEDNARRSARLVKVLERARKKIMQAIKGKYLQAALGGQEVESVSTVTRLVRVDGQATPAEMVQETRTKTKTLPNMQALATLMFHYDKDWRKVQRGLDDETQDIPTNIETGIDIHKWIEKEVGVNLKD
ncbi:MAG: hypothetical protein IJ640_01080 [Prevotella sp.]|nr:hypothetical protein [Prevotella sp.]